MPIERVERQPFEYSPVIFAVNRIRHHLNRIHRVVQTSLVIEDRAVKFFLRREMAKDHRLRHAGGMCNLFSRRATETALRKQPLCKPQNLQPALSARHARAVCGRADTRSDWFLQRSHKGRSRLSK